MSGKTKVAVLFGGQSSEHEVSRVSACSVLENMDRSKYDVRMIGITKSGEWLPYEGGLSRVSSGEWEAVARVQQAERRSGLKQVAAAATCRGLLGETADGEVPVDVVFPVLHGPNGEDGTVQGLFQLAGVPYVGCGLLASAAGMDKEFAKLVFNNAGIHTARHIKVLRSEIAGCSEVIASRIMEGFGWPCFVKPANAGSSVGVSKVKSAEALLPALVEAAKFDSKILVEEFIDGRELECAILGNEEPIASVVGEVVPCNEFYDFTAKYEDARSQTIIPADLSDEDSNRVRELAVRAFRALGATGLSRVDFFLERGTGRVVLNEINTMPGFTSISMYGKLWAATGIPYPELVDRLIQLALARHEQSGFSIERK